MDSEMRTILKTCSICKATFPTIRQLIAHESGHQPKLAEPWAVPVGPSVRKRNPASQSHQNLAATLWPSLFTPIRHSVSKKPAFETGIEKKRRTVVQNGRDRQVETNLISRKVVDQSPHGSIQKSSVIFGNSTDSVTGKKENPPSLSAAVKNSSTMNLSIVKHHWVCEYCLGEFKTKKFLGRHQLGAHYGGDGTLRYFCSICDGRGTRRFLVKADFETHIKTIHGVTSTIFRNRLVDDAEKKMEACSSSVNHSASVIDNHDRSFSARNKKADEKNTSMVISDISVIDQSVSMAADSRSVPAAAASNIDQPSPFARETATSTDSLNDDVQIDTADLPNNSTSTSDWLCRYCLGYKGSHIALVMHQLRMHSLEDKLTYYCRLCSTKGHRVYFSQKNKFYAHMVKKHGYMVRDIGNGDVSCTPKPTTSADQPKSSEMDSSDRRTTEDVMRLSYCRYCFKQHFRRRGLFSNAHQRLHRDGKYFCSICKERERFNFRIFAGEEEFHGHLMEKHGFTDKFIADALNLNRGRSRKKRKKNQPTINKSASTTKGRGAAADYDQEIGSDSEKSIGDQANQANYGIEIEVDESQLGSGMDHDPSISSAWIAIVKKEEPMERNFDEDAADFCQESTGVQGNVAVISGNLKTENDHSMESIHHPQMNALSADIAERDKVDSAVSAWITTVKEEPDE